MVEAVGLTESEADRRVGTYSLGMRQRLGVAAALIGEPAVLILDEPANGLDPAGIRWMRDLLRGYADQGGTVLLSSHLLHEVEVIADDIVMIGKGRIVSQGSKAELLGRGGHRRPRRRHRPPSSGPSTSRRPRRPSTDDGALRADADPARVGLGALRRPASPSPSCAQPTAGSRRCSSQLTADTQRERKAA